MHKVVDLLLERMKTHPEEFLPEDTTSLTESYVLRGCRFSYVVTQIMQRKHPNETHTVNGILVRPLEFVSEDELEKLYQGLLNICADNFYARIVNDLANNDWSKERDDALFFNMQRQSLQTQTQQSLLLNAQQRQGMLSSLFGGSK